LLQARYVSAAGDIVKAGGPTVKNVSGFDLCRLLVGSHGTLGFIGEVMLRTRPVTEFEQWYTSTADPDRLLRNLYRPTSLLWDGTTSWILLEGHRSDVTAQANENDLTPADPPPEMPTGGRWSVAPSQLASLAGTGRFIAEVGVGIVHHMEPAPARVIDAPVIELHRRIKNRFDPTGRLNPGVDVLALA
jgi:glycolate oxidase FAD binding subunit